MAPDNSLTSLSATELVARLRDGRIGSRELLDAYAARIERDGAAINAIVTTDWERARRLADAADAAYARGELLGPLHGLPVTVKDTYDTEGVRTTIGVPWLKNNVPTRDAALVARLKAAGAIVFGKSNLPFASYDWQCDNPLFGRCHNPHRAGFIPGGSSGGAAAAVAGQMTAFDVGSDVAGSIRFPAHCCGVFGLRATERLLDATGHGNVPGAAHSLRHFVSLGPIARSAEDLALAMRVLIDENDILGRATLAHPVKPLAESRIAFTESWAGVPVSRDTRATLLHVVERARAAGAEVVEVPPPFDMDEALRVWAAVHGFELRAAYPWLARVLPGRWLLRLFGFRFQFGAGRFARYLGRAFTDTAGDYFDALQRRDELIAIHAEFLTRFDVWLTPVAATPAFAYQSPRSPVDVDGVAVPYNEVASAYNCSTAVSGHPVVAMPAGRSTDGMPIGVQLHGRRGADFALIAIAGELSGKGA